MYNFFTNFPLVTYNGTLSVNLLAKIKFKEIALKNSAVFYPYTIAEGERPDVIAANYYDDPRYSWVVYLCNDIVDPLYDWPLIEKDFKEYIIKKYGSIDAAYREIAYWEDNWYEDETVLTVAAYEALPANRKKYFKPIFGINNNVVSYERNQLDLSLESNKTIEITVNDTTGFIVGEYISQNNSGQLSGSGFIKAISDNKIVAQNILGTFANTAGSVSNVTGIDSRASSSVSNVITTHVSIPADEQAYWTYVTKYDYENQLNESKKFIRLIDKSFIDQIEKEIGELL